ncbi:MAG TPA: hypothetical protein VMC08_11025 [Bacteroidales bacterium]|nr:hypothetical protein [Bacteroidales bacterium]
MKHKVYTSTLPEDLLLLVNEYAEKYHVPKARLVENALRSYLSALKRKEFREGFKRASGDAEVTGMAELGIADYREILRDPEKNKP